MGPVLGVGAGSREGLVLGERGDREVLQGFEQMWRPIGKSKRGPVRRGLQRWGAGLAVLLLRTLSRLHPSVVQVFCVIPKYIQPFLRQTIGTRE